MMVIVEQGGMKFDKGNLRQRHFVPHKSRAAVVGSQRLAT
jgi:hypothetical protein